MLIGLSILLIANGVVTVIADPGWSAPEIKIFGGVPGNPVTFRIYFYLLYYEGTYNAWTLRGPSPLNPYLWKIELPNGIWPAPAIRVFDPDGIEYQWVGPTIVVQKPGVGPGNPGADSGYFVDIVFDPNDPNWWDKWEIRPDTSKPGRYRVDFDGRSFLAGVPDRPFLWSRYFDIEHKFYVPEISSISVALILSGLTMLVLRKRLVKNSFSIQ